MEPFDSLYLASPLDQALDVMKAEAKTLASMMGFEMACQVGAFAVVDEIDEDGAAMAYVMEAVAVAYLEVALAEGAFAEGVPGVVESVAAGFVDIPVVADWQQEERDVDPVVEEVLLKALKHQKAAFAPLEPMNQMLEWLRALQLQYLEWFLHFG